MKKIIFLLLAMLLQTGAWAAPKDGVHPRYGVLDRELDLSERYDAIKEHRLDSLRLMLRDERNVNRAYRLAMQLGDEYHSFSNDSSLYYYRRALDLAAQTGDRGKAAYSRLMLVNQYAFSSKHREALEEMGSITVEDLPDSSLSRYYATFSNLYDYMGDEVEGSQSEEYHLKARAFNDSLMAVADKSSTLYYQRQCSQLIGQERLDEAAIVCDEWAATLKPSDRDYAVMAYYQAEIAGHTNRLDDRKFWLVESSVNDIRHSTKHQMSLWNLAQMIADEGDADRAYLYVEHSWECVQKFNAGELTSLISPVFTSINLSYNQRLQKANHRMQMLVVAAFLLAIGLGASYGFTRRRGKQLERAREELLEKNDKLSAMNREQVALNSQLSALNNQLTELYRHQASLNNQLTEVNNQLAEVNGDLISSNAQLSEANRLKEEYIVQFFSICSQYIDKIDKYRLTINRKLIAGQAKDVLKMTSSEQLLEDEQKQLLDNFDRIFLGLFPNFVERFNALLQPEERITTHGKQLSTTLRIFALIRLGIEESASIAEFLNYPAGTIYNYRNRIKVKALGDRQLFEEQVKRIGMD